VSPHVFVGIDVAKAHLDIALRPTGTRWTVANDEAGIAALVTQLHGMSPTLIVLEATGGLQRPVVAALTVAALPVVVVNPRQVRDFAKATGQLAKTDALDARALVHFADAIRPTPRPVADAETEDLRALLARRRQLVAMRTAEQNRLGSAPPRLHADIEAHITWLNERLATLDNDLDTTLQASPLWRAREDLLRSVPGIGPVCARTLGLDLPELGHLEPPAPGRVGRAGPLPSGQRHPPWDPYDLGWACSGTYGPVYEHPGGGTLQSGAQGVLSAPPGGWEARESGLGSLYA
jgi:transposase